MSDLEGGVAVVTGASQGIGREIALDLSRSGARVMALARNRSGLDETVSLAEGSPGGVQAWACDVSDSAAVSEVVGSILKEAGQVDYLVNNAGVTRDGLLMRMKDQDWETVLGTNLTGAFRLCRAVVPAMIRARSGRVVNISSVVATAGNPGQANYAASKAGLEGFTRSLAREVASRKVTVNAIAPGYIETAMTAELPEKTKETLLARIPMGVLGTGGDIAAAVRFLCGEGGRYVTGQVLHVNGGMYM